MDTKLFTYCSKNQKCNITDLNRFLIVALLYLTDRPKQENFILEKLFSKTNHKSIHRLYANIKEAVRNGTQRVDYIEVIRKEDRYKKIKDPKKRRRARRKKKQELMDDRLRIDPVIEEQELEKEEQKEEEFNTKINKQFDTVALETLPNIQAPEERDRDLEQIGREQIERERLENIRKQEQFKQEILEERDELFEKEISVSDNNFNKRELSYFKDDSLPNMFRFLTYAEPEHEIIETPPPSVIDYFENNSESEMAADVKSIPTIKKKKKRGIRYDIYKV